MYHLSSLSVTTSTNHITAGETDVELQEDECKIITEQTVFDHIREKAKKFPVLAASSNARSPSSEALPLTRKRTLGQLLELHREVEVLEETGRNKIPRQGGANPSSESREVEHNGINTNKCITPKPQVTARSLGAAIEDWLPPEPEQGAFKTLTEESIFDHISKKSKNFPVINKSKTIISEPSLWTQEHSEGRDEFGSSASETLKDTNSDKVLKDTIVISDFEPSEVEKDACSKESTKVKHNLFPGSSSGTFGLLNIPPRASGTNGDLSSIKMLSFDISMLKNNEQIADPVSSTKSSRKQQHSPRESKRQQCSRSEPRRQFCSSETASETREADSYLGFKSVFSFLL